MARTWNINFFDVLGILLSSSDQCIFLSIVFGVFLVAATTKTFILIRVLIQINDKTLNADFQGTTPHIDYRKTFFVLHSNQFVCVLAKLAVCCINIFSVHFTLCLFFPILLINSPIFSLLSPTLSLSFSLPYYISPTL